jgi:hypothetical protein
MCYDYLCTLFSIRSKMKIFNSFAELAAANGTTAYGASTGNITAKADFVPMWGEIAPTDNTISEAVAAAKSMGDFNAMYSSAVDAAIDVSKGETSNPDGVPPMETAFAQAGRTGIISGIGEVAEQLDDAQAREEFQPSSSPHFAKDMKDVYKANAVVQKGLGHMDYAEKQKLDMVPPETREDADKVNDYADLAKGKRASRYSTEKKEEAGVKQLIRDAHKPFMTPDF